MKSIIKKLLGPFLFLLVDKRSFRGLRNANFFNLIYYNVRFKLAGKGIYLTKNEKWLASLKDKYKGERCFIIGNGPSLNKMDLTRLKDEYTFGVNAIYLNYEKMQFHPRFYAVEDPLVAEDRADEISNYKGAEIKFIGFFLDYVIRKDEKTITINFLNNFEEPYSPVFSENCLPGATWGGTVSYLCMQLAFYMGFQKVYLIGFDHHYVIPKYTDITKSDLIESQHDDENHFSKDYFGKGYRWHDPKSERMEKSYQKAKEHFEAANREIYNATVGGKLEVFKRIDYDTLF